MSAGLSSAGLKTLIDFFTLYSFALRRKFHSNPKDKKTSFAIKVWVIRSCAWVAQHLNYFSSSTHTRPEKTTRILIILCEKQSSFANQRRGAAAAAALPAAAADRAARIGAEAPGATPPSLSSSSSSSSGTSTGVITPQASLAPAFPVLKRGKHIFVFFSRCNIASNQHTWACGGRVPLPPF